MFKSIALLLSLMHAPDTASRPPEPKPALKLPPQIIVQPGAWVRVVAETNCRNLRWKFDAAFDRIDPTWLADPTKHFAGRAPTQPGTYRLEAVGTVGDEWIEAQTLIVVGAQPVPGPTPTPDVPTPIDPLFGELQRLFTADSTPRKIEYRNTLADIYRTAATAAIRDPAVTTTAQIFAKLRGVSKLLLSDDALTTLRDALRVDCQKHFSTDVPLTDDLRAKASAYFERIASLLVALK